MVVAASIWYILRHMVYGGHIAQTQMRSTHDI